MCLDEYFNECYVTPVNMRIEKSECCYKGWDSRVRNLVFGFPILDSVSRVVNYECLCGLNVFSVAAFSVEIHRNESIDHQNPFMR